jgi:hypothetical protein
MRFLMYKLGDESVPVPNLTPDQMVEMRAVAEEATKAGVLLTNGGIAPTAAGARVTVAGGQVTVTDGPFTEAKEVVGGWALLEVRDRDEAVVWASRFQGAAGDGELRVRQVY